MSKSKFSELRNSRQAKMVPSEPLSQTVCVVIGLGAIGKQVATTLAAMGASKIILLDGDTVGEENLSPQKFVEADLNKNKAIAVADECRALNSLCEIIAFPRFFDKKDIKLLDGAFVFCCVDKMKARKEIFEMACSRKAKYFSDTRTLNEISTLYTVPNPDPSAYYASTLFKDEEAYQASCTTKMTSYMANAVGGASLARFAQFLRGDNDETALSFDLLSWSISDARTATTK